MTKMKVTFAGKAKFVKDLEPGAFFRFKNPTPGNENSIYQKIVDESTRSGNEPMNGYYALRVGRVLHKEDMMLYWSAKEVEELELSIEARVI